MRKSIFMSIFGLMILISTFPIGYFLRDQICLLCLFTPIIFITGLVIMINGVLVFARGMKKDDSGVDIDEDRMNLESLMEPIFLIRDASVRIIRNRRRTSAMLSGIILSSLVIASVFIFTEAMQEDFYNDFVQEVPWEASFTYKEEGNESYLWDLGERISDDKRVESYTVISRTQTGDIDEFGGGDNYDKYTDTYVDFYAYLPTPENLTEEERKVYERVDPEPIFGRNSFKDTTIYDKIFGDDLEGSFDLDPSENRTVIPRSKANKLFIEVGDTIEEIVVELSFETKTRELEESGTITLRLRNVTVAGIYDDSDNEEDSDVFFFNTELIEIYKPEMKQRMDRHRLFQLAVKIDPSEFNTANMDKMVDQVDDLVGDIERESENKVSGSNNIEGVVFFLNIIRYVLVVIDFIMILPVVILSIYFLIFGLDLSLEERKREVAILKVQGANPRQIFGLFSMEAFILFVVGLTIGYFLAIVAAWFINSSIGFMNFDLDMSKLENLMGYHQDAVIASMLIVGLIVLVSVFIKARRFIKQEVSEGVQKMKEKKPNIFQLLYVDMVLFGFGAISALKVILDKVFDFNEIMGIRLGFGEGWDTFIFVFLGTIALWVGGALSGPRISQWIALKTEKVFLRLFFLKDVALIIKSGLRRRGDTAKLILIIVLTLSVATLAAVQGLTDQKNSERLLEYQIGADFRVSMNNKGDFSQELGDIEGIEEAMAIPSELVQVYSGETVVYGIVPANASYFEWQEDSFKGMSSDEALRKLERRSGENAVFLGKDIADSADLKKGDIFPLTIPRSNPVNRSDAEVSMNAVVVGIFDHFPGDIGRSSIICDHSTLLKIRSLKNQKNIHLTGTVTVEQINGEEKLIDHSPDQGLWGYPFIFNISVSDEIEVERVLANWTHTDRGENLTLFETGEGSYMGLAYLNTSYRPMNYTIHILDKYGNINSSEKRSLDVFDNYYPNHVLDLSPTMGYAGRDYVFRFSIGPNIPIESIYLEWSQGSSNGNVTLVLEDGFYISTVSLDQSINDLSYKFHITDPVNDLNATLFLLDMESGARRSEVRKGLDRNINISDYRDLAQEKDDIVDQINFGIPGLLTMMFVASLIAVFTSAFAFSSIIIKRRMREFAVLQTVGATRWQVYKIAVGENALVMFISVVMGLIVGIGLSYLMNGFFELLGQILQIGSQNLERLVFFPWPVILGISGAIFLGMLGAVAFSAVSAARQDLAVSTRVV
jgi:ABC-type antimicrobial peptide transport system permease subunit